MELKLSRADIAVMELFLSQSFSEKNVSEVAKETGISRITIERIWADLIARRIIIKSREVGRAELYRLNSESPLVKALQETNFKLASAYGDLELKVHSSRKAMARA